MSDFSTFAQVIRAAKSMQQSGNELAVAPRSYSPADQVTPRRLKPLPADALLFGMADDGKPLLLTLSDPHPGPILVTAERGSGKTHFLKMLIQSAERLKQPGEIRFAVLTCYPKDFTHVRAPKHLAGVWSANDELTAEMIYQVACLVESGENQQPFLLLIDGLDAILQLDSVSQENIAYILAEGPQQMVWPIVTANADMIVEWPDWLACFRTRMYGRVSNPRTAEELTPIPGAPLNSLLPGTQFCMREKSQWLKFWLPTLPA